jgi:hypothetical protein
MPFYSAAQPESVPGQTASSTRMISAIAIYPISDLVTDVVELLLEKSLGATRTSSEWGLQMTRHEHATAVCS